MPNLSLDVGDAAELAEIEILQFLCDWLAAEHDGLAALVAWSGLDADDYVRSEDGERPEAEPLAMISTYLWSDRNLTPQAATALGELINATYETLRKH